MPAALPEQDEPIVVATDDNDQEGNIRVSQNIGSLTIRKDGTTYTSNIIVATTGSTIEADATFDGFGVIRLDGLHTSSDQIGLYRLTGDFGDSTVESITLNW